MLYDNFFHDKMHFFDKKVKRYVIIVSRSITLDDDGAYLHM